MRNISLIMASFLMAVFLPGLVLAGPVIVVDTPVFEFDSVPEGVRIDHDFVIRNTGDTDLHIENVLPP